MTESDCKRWAESLTRTYGLELSGTFGHSSSGDYCDFSPAGIHANEGFALRVLIGWRSVEAEFRPGSFARDLIHDMAAAGVERKAAFSAIAKSLSRDGAQLSMRVNNNPISVERPDIWPGEWEKLELSLLRSPVDLDPQDSGKIDAQVLTWGGRLLGMLIALLPLEEADFQSDADIHGLPEGAVERIEVNRYERSPLNRAACIAIHGYSCKACDIEMATVYGPIGERYIQVHHITPVSQLGAGYLINPAEDLVPVCPNCHTMLHRQDPPLSVAQLREVIAHQGRTASS